MQISPATNSSGKRIDFYVREIEPTQIAEYTYPAIHSTPGLKTRLSKCRNQNKSQRETIELTEDFSLNQNNTNRGNKKRTKMLSIMSRTYSSTSHKGLPHHFIWGCFNRGFDE